MKHVIPDLIRNLRFLPSWFDKLTMTLSSSTRNNYGFTAPCHSGLDPESEILVIMVRQAHHDIGIVNKNCNYCFTALCHSRPRSGISEILTFVRMTLSSYRSWFDRLTMTLASLTRNNYSFTASCHSGLDPESEILTEE